MRHRTPRTFRPRHLLRAVLPALLLAALLALSGCLDEASDTSYDYDNENDTLDSGSSSDDSTDIAIIYLDSVEEIVVLVNTGTEDIAMANYVLRELTDTDGDNWYTFSEYTLSTEGYVRIHSADGDDSSTDLYWSGGVTWAPGDTVVIQNAEATILDTCDGGDLCWGQ